MELIAELNPPRDPVRLLEIAERFSEVFDWIDIPDAPLGKPNYNSPVVAAYLVSRGFRVIAHLRVSDVNTIALKTITKTLGSLGVPRIVYLKGDPPQQGSSVEDFTPEDAVYYARSRPEAPEPGLLLSLRKGIEAIRNRLNVPAGFYFVLNYDWEKGSNIELLKNVSALARSMDKKLYAYLIIPGEICSQPGRVSSLTNQVTELVDGIVFSAPHSVDCIVECGRIARDSIS
ncbi:MAG: methylenetetrahydrofolate reductase [Desulfurococcales archaeon]|nr:methylenetetrahydrofolate reductase [Desulfurococcales archaeon]